MFQWLNSLRAKGLLAKLEDLDQDDSSQIDIADRLGRLCVAAAVPPLVSLSGTLSREVRIAAVKALERILQKIPNKISVVDLIAVTQVGDIDPPKPGMYGGSTESHELPARYMEPLDESGLAVFIRFRSSGPGEIGVYSNASLRALAESELRRRGKQAISDIVSHLETQELGNFFFLPAIQWLESGGAAKKAIPALVRIARNDALRRQTRIEAAIALIRVSPENKEGLSLIRTALQSKDELVQCRVLERIGSYSLGPKSAPLINDLVKLLRSSRFRVLELTIRILGHIGPEAAVAVPALTAIWARDFSLQTIDVTGFDYMARRLVEEQEKSEREGIHLTTYLALKSIRGEA